ncbi:restriction endonuclease subunit S [Shewanella algae]|uniref:EcoKI restriction-modification system protein HsdS n=1 Tax=Shewanella algae TaxID=38313 RepID=A0A380BQ91_9GAMM|nr:restriction endonuclease subunit S [Shewanella algae]MBO2607888.1 restriction endonuclease subunit S [Shewanella algae]SUJ05135.1 EcoKI restriction-modification system protein HsdS [Shewanella algae]
MVPEGWLKTNFGAVTEIANGQVDPKVEPYLNMLHIGPENVVSDSGQIIDVVTCKESGFISGKYEFDENAIVYSKIRPNLNKVCRPGFKGVCSADMYPIWAKSELDIEFLLHYMLGPLFYKVAVAMSMRTGMPKINRSDLNTVPLLLPPVDEQKKIAQILSTWDKAITTTEQLLANSQQQKKALMQQLLTGKKRLLDKNGGRFSGEWKWSKIQEVGMVVTGSTPPKSDENNYGGDVLWATAEDFTGKYVSDTKIKLSDKGSTKARIVPKGSVLVTCIASIGKNAIANEDMGTNQQINAVVVSDSFSNEFFYYQIEFNVNKLINIAGVTAVPIVNKSSFQQVKLIFPVLEEQQKIAVVLSTADQEISTLQQKLDALKQEKKALMQQLLTGKRRVKVDGVVHA